MAHPFSSLYSLFKFFILSVLIHIILFQSFIIVIPQMSEANKPNFVFLGSILSNLDTDIQPHELKTAKPISTSISSNITVNDIRAFAPALQMNKPKDEQFLKNQLKPVQKSTFLETLPSNENQPVYQREEIEPFAPLYKPLKFNKL